MTAGRDGHVVFVSDTDAEMDVADVSNTVPLFDSIADELAGCVNFTAVQSVADRWKEEVAKFVLPLPLEPNKLSSVGCSIDTAALGYLQPELREKCFALSVLGDGNCFFRSLSLLLFGNEVHHKELRVRTVMAMALNQDLFLNGENWRAEHEQLSSDEIIKVAVMTSACSVTPETTPGFAFQEEVVAISQTGIFTGLWELFAAAFVTRFPHSVCVPQSWVGGVPEALPPVNQGTQMHNRPHTFHPVDLYPNSADLFTPIGSHV